MTVSAAASRAGRTPSFMPSITHRLLLIICS